MKGRWRYLIAGLLSLGLAISLSSPSQAAYPSRVTPTNRTEVVIGNPANFSLSSHLALSNSAQASIDIGRQQYSTGQFSAAATTWQAAIDSAKANGDLQTQALALSYRSLAHQSLNQWALAQQAIDESMALLDQISELDQISDPVQPLLLAQILNTKASLTYQLGQAETALEIWQQVEDYYQQADDTAGMLGSQINQAQALQSLGYYRRSRQQLEAIAQQLRPLPDSALKVNGFRTLGMALQVLGDLEGSRAALFESANIAIAIDAPNELSAAYLSLGKAASSWGDQAATIEMFERSHREALSPADRLHANLERLRFYIEVPNAEPTADRIAQITEEIVEYLQTTPPSRLSVYATVNFIHSLDKEPSLGRSLPIEQQNQLLSKAVAAAQTLKDLQAEAYALNQWGTLYMRTQQWSEALKLTTKSLEIARSIQADDTASQAAWQKGRILVQQNNKPEAIKAYSEAVDKLQALRRDLVAINPEVQFSFRENVEPIYRELVSLLLDVENTSNQKSSQQSNQQSSQQNLVQAREVIEALQLAELDNFFQEACIDVASQQIDQVDTQATVIYPIILPERLAVIAATPGQPLAYYSTPVSAEAVEETLHDLLDALHPASGNRARLALSKQVYDWLVQPAEASQLTNDTETIVFVLDGPLRNIPMAALYDGEQYLIEKYAVALSPGLQLMQARPLEQIEPSVVVGGISEARNGLSALPAVETEIADISQLVSANTLFNEDFTSDSLFNEVKNSSASVVHLATHGQFSSRLEDTFLATWEGRLSVKELSEILQTRDQSNAIELLVLSACDTASGDNRAVLGLAGLAVQSGARSTIATLWPVQDAAAAQLVKALYEGLRQPGMSKAEALRQAQLSLLADPNYSHPLLWSAYTLVGNWQ